MVAAAYCSINAWASRKGRPALCAIKLVADLERDFAGEDDLAAEDSRT
jgi:hypothetical protein